MELERGAMRLYCRFERQATSPEELRRFWLKMAQHESRHFGALALAAGLLEETPPSSLPTIGLTPTRIRHLRRLLDRLHREVSEGISVERAFEMSLEIESSEIEDVVLDLLRSLKAGEERERTVQLLIHDLGDLSYMVEKYTTNQALLARVDAVLEGQLGRLRAAPLKTGRRSRRVRG